MVASTTKIEKPARMTAEDWALAALDVSGESGLAAIALEPPVVKRVLSRVPGRRLDYLTDSFRQAGLGRMDAQNRARLLYAAYVGFLQLSLQLGQPRLHHDEFETYVSHVMDTLIPA